MLCVFCFSWETLMAALQHSEKHSRNKLARVFDSLNIHSISMNHEYMSINISTSVHQLSLDSHTNQAAISKPLAKTLWPNFNFERSCSQKLSKQSKNNSYIQDFPNTTNTTTSQSLPFSAPSFKLLLLKSHESSETSHGICVSSVKVFTIKDKK